MNEQQAFKVFKLIFILRNLVEYHSNLYFNLDSPKISDKDFDLLYNKLLKLEKENPWSITEDSPTQKPGGSVSKKFKKIKHRVFMPTLKKVHSIKEFIEWDKGIRKLLRSNQ